MLSLPPPLNQVFDFPSKNKKSCGFDYSSTQDALNSSSNVLYEQRIYELIKENQPVSIIKLKELLPIDDYILSQRLQELFESRMIKVFLICNDIEYYVSFHWKGVKI